MNKNLRVIHLYLGCIFAPTLIFFSFTGALQVLDLHVGRKDNSYTPPRIISHLSEAHIRQRLEFVGAKSKSFAWFAATAAVLLIATTILGIILAFQTPKHRLMAAVSLVLGFLIPTAMLLL